MRAAVIEALSSDPCVRDFPDPRPSGDLEVAPVSAAALNPLDQHFATGRYPGAPLPHVVGREGIATLADGRRVHFFSRPLPAGAAADFAVVDPDAVYDVPDGLDDGQALAIGVAGLAAWLALTAQARLQEGERVLVLGASGIVGQFAMQVAKLLGASRVVGAARDTAAAEAVGAADAVVPLVAGKFEAALRTAAEDGFDVVVDPLGGEYLSGAVSATGVGARLVNLGSSAGVLTTLDVKALQGRTLIGHSTGFVATTERLAAYARMAEHMLAGELRVSVEHFGLDDVAAAWARQAQSSHTKVVITVGGPRP